MNTRGKCLPDDDQLKSLAKLGHLRGYCFPALWGRLARWLMGDLASFQWETSQLFAVGLGTFPLPFMVFAWRHSKRQMDGHIIQLFPEK